MSTCAVKGCTNSYRKTAKIQGTTIKYFTFPKNAEFTEAWLKVCRNGVSATNGKITLIYINI